MPSNKQVGLDRVWRVFSNLVSHASKDELLVWVSDLTQETETGLDRRTIRTARILLEEQGLLVDMQRKEKDDAIAKILKHYREMWTWNDF